MRVLSDGARRLINEMKKLRLSLIFNEQGRGRSRASGRRGYNGRRSPGPDVGGPRNITSPSRVAHLHAHGSSETRANKKFRPYPVCSRCIFSGEGSLLTVPQHGRCARRLALLLFRPAIVKYKRLERSADSPPAHPGFVRNEYLVVSR